MLQTKGKIAVYNLKTKEVAAIDNLLLAFVE